MDLHIATSGRRQAEAIEGPTKAQARRMAARRTALIEQARAELAAGRDDVAFNCDADAYDLEVDLIRYGFDPTTGKVLRAR